MKNEKFFSTTEVAKMLDVSNVTVFNMIKRKEIKANKVGRNYIIDSKDLGIFDDKLSKSDKNNIDVAVKRVFKEYGETLKKLGKE